MDECVREALWGKPGTPFDEKHPFYLAVQALARVRAQHPALRYGRFYFRQISGDKLSFSVSTLSPGVVAFSRVLNDEEVLVVANIAGTAPPPLTVIVDGNLHADGSRMSILYSNRATPTAPSPVFTVGNTGPVSIVELDGSRSSGPARVVTLTLGPREAQILG